MSGPRKISTRILLLASVNAAISVSCFLLLDYFGAFSINVAYLLLSTFICFVVSFLVLYYFYYVDVTQKVNGLTEKIRQRFLINEIPQKLNQLEDEDGIAKLEERVDYLIESRE